MALVLVVDDEEEVRRVVEVMLKNAGYDVVLAVDGNDALRQFSQRHFDLVICDVFMPNKEGMETLKELRQFNPIVPVIMMSGVAPTTHRWGTTTANYLAMATSLGATRTIQKPFRYLQLVTLIRECLAK
jgi:CheY-like chemotaxis protein